MAKQRRRIRVGDLVVGQSHAFRKAYYVGRVRAIGDSEVFAAPISDNHPTPSDAITWASDRLTGQRVYYFPS